MTPEFRPPPIFPEGEPLFRVGGSIDSCSASLRFFGDDLNPDELTALLGAQPTACCRKGDLFRGTKYDRIEKQGKWLFQIKHTTDLELEELIRRLLTNLSADLSVWRTLTSRFKADIFCGVQLEQWNRGFSLSTDLLKQLSDRNLPIGFDIYYVGERKSVNAD